MRSLFYQVFHFLFVCQLHTQDSYIAYRNVSVTICIGCSQLFFRKCASCREFIRQMQANQSYIAYRHFSITVYISKGIIRLSLTTNCAFVVLVIIMAWCSKNGFLFKSTTRTSLHGASVHCTGGIFNNRLPKCVSQGFDGFPLFHIITADTSAAGISRFCAGRKRF